MVAELNKFGVIGLITKPSQRDFMIQVALRFPFKIFSMFKRITFVYNKKIMIY